MDVWRLTVAALRRWYLLLPLLALTGFAAVQAGQGVAPQYEVTATAMLVPGTGAGVDPTQVQAPNPYGGMDNAAQVVAIVLNSNETRAEIAAQGLNPAYEVGAAPRSTILNLTVTGATGEEGIATLDAVLAAAATELQTRQDEAGVHPGLQYGIATISAPAVSAVIEDGKTRIMAIIGVVGAAIAFLVAVLFDDMVGLIKRRRQRRRERKAAKLASAQHESAAATAESEQPDGDAEPDGDAGSEATSDRETEADAVDETEADAVDETEADAVDEPEAAPETERAEPGPSEGERVDAESHDEPSPEERMVPAGREG